MQQSPRSPLALLLAVGVGVVLALVLTAGIGLMVVGARILRAPQNASAPQPDASPPPAEQARVDPPPDEQIVEAPPAPPKEPPLVVEDLDDLPATPIVERRPPLGAGPLRPRLPVAPGQASDGRWRADLASRKSAESRLFNLADQAENAINQLVNAQRTRNPGTQKTALQQLDNLRRLLSNEYDRLNAMGWTPVDGRSDGDLLAERNALVDEMQTLVNPGGGRFSKQVKLRVAAQRRTRVEELDALLGVKSP